MLDFVPSTAPVELWLLGAGGVSHAQARTYAIEGFKQTFGREPNLTEVQFAQAVGMLETYYGTTWKGDGVGSNNIGAIQSSKPPCGPDSFLYKDSYPTKSGQQVQYEVCFRKYATPADGWAGLMKELYQKRPAVLAAAGRGDLYGFAAAMYDSHYYGAKGKTREARIDYYLTGLEGASKAIAKSLKEPIPVANRPSSSGSRIGSAVVIIGIGALGWWLYKRAA